MQGQHSKQPASSAQMGEALGKHRQAIAHLAQSGDAQKLVSMLKQTGGVQQAAQAAAQGDASQLMGMMNQLMSTKEGAALVERLRRRAEESGLS